MMDFYENTISRFYTVELFKMYTRVNLTGLAIARLLGEKEPCPEKQVRRILWFVAILLDLINRDN